MVVCFTSQVIPNSQSIDTAIATGGTTDVQCTEGYQGRGNMTAVCSPSQTWIKPTGHCRRKYKFPKYMASV